MARRKAVRGCISLARLARPRRRQRREQSALQLCSVFLALDSAHAERCGYQIQVSKDRTLWQCDGIACDLQARLLLCVCCTNSYTRDRADRFAYRRLSCRTRTDAACLRTSSVSCFSPSSKSIKLLDLLQVFSECLLCRHLAEHPVAFHLVDRAHCDADVNGHAP